MGKWTTLILVLFILTGCQPNQIVQTLTRSETIIEWVDFINLDGKEYYGLHSAVLADESYVDKKLEKSSLE